MRKRKRAENILDFGKIVDSHRKSLPLSFNVLFKISKRLSQAKYTCSNLNLEDVRVVKFVRESAEMAWKSTYSKKI